MGMVTLLPWILSDTNINDTAACWLRLLMVKRFIFEKLWTWANYHLCDKPLHGKITPCLDIDGLNHSV